jgi:predicted dehydrogenase
LQRPNSGEGYSDCGPTCAWSEHGHPARVQIAGTGGSAFLADEALEAWDFHQEQPGDAEIRHSLVRSAGPSLGGSDPGAIDSLQHQRNFEELVNAIQEGREPSTGAAEARAAVSLITAMYASARSGGARIEPA